MAGIGGIGRGISVASRSLGLDAAAKIMAASRVGRGVSVQGIAAGIANLSRTEPRAAAVALQQIRKQLSPVQQGQLARELPAAIAAEQRAAQRLPAGLTPQQKELMLDLGQIGLDIVGLVDPTPVSDGLNGIVSLFRGDFLGAGISAVSMIPYIGDAAKLGKLGKWSKTIDRALDVARAAPNSAMAKALRPAIEKIADGLNAIPASVLNKLPDSAKKQIIEMRAKANGFLRGADNVVAATIRTVSAKVGRNEIKWTLDAAGRPVSAQATLRQVFTGAARSADEVAAQGTVGGAARLATDNGGHVLGHRFVKDQGLKNLFPQNAQFNKSAYKKLENEVADWIKAGGEVRVNVQLVGESGGRPAKVAVEYEVVNPKTGAVIYDNNKLFSNSAGEGFNRLSTNEIAARMR